MRQTAYILFLTIMIMAMSCTKLDLTNMDEMGYKTSLAMPICKYEADVLEILTSGDTDNIVVVDGKTIYLTWETTVEPDTIEVMDIKKGEPYRDTIQLKEIEELGMLRFIRDSIRVQKGTITHTDTVVYSFGFNRESETKEYIVDSIVFSKADIRFDFDIEGVTLNKSNYIVLTYSFPGLKRCAQNTFTDIITKKKMTVRHRIEDFVADFTECGVEDNGIEMAVTMKFVSDGSMYVKKSAEFRYQAQFENLEFKEAYGSLWNDSAIRKRIVSLKVPESLYNQELFKKNKLLFHNPEMELNIRHNLGTKVRYKINSMYAVDKEGNKRYADFEGRSSCWKTLKRPTEPYEMTDETIVFNRQHGETNRLFDGVVDSVVMEYDIFVGDKEVTGDDFFVDATEMDMKMKTITEMWFDAARDFVREDTVVADIIEAGKFLMENTEIDTFFISLVVHNHIPVQMSVNAVFFDSADNVLCFVENLHIECPKLDEKGAVIEATNQILEPIIFAKERVNLVLQTKKIKFAVIIEAKDAESLTNIQAGDKLSIEVSAFARVKAKLNHLFDN